MLLSLLAIPLTLFKVIRPGRDTQGARNLSTTWYSFQSFIGLLVHLPCAWMFCHVMPAICGDFDLDLGPTCDVFWCWMFFSSFIFSMISISSRLFEWIIPWFFAAVSTFASYRRSSCPFHRRHGRWRCQKIFPTAFLVLSSHSVTSFQVSSFTAKGLHRSPFVGFPSSRPVRRHRRSKRSMRDLVVFLNDTFALSRDAATFYEPRIFDDLFAHCETDPSHLSIPTGDLLSAYGTFMGESWMEEMAAQASHPFNDPDLGLDIDEIFDSLLQPPSGDDDASTFSSSSSSSSSTMCLSTPIGELSDNVVSELLIRPTRLAKIAATASSNHLVDMEHILRASKAKNGCNCEQFDSQKVFPILIDTGCSVSCSGFVEDFHGEIAFGDFGHVKTADGLAKIEGFGILRWDTMTSDGNRIAILVPGYFSPTVQLRLLSPQDYCRYHHLSNNEPHYSGNSDWMHMHVKDAADKLQEVVAVIDGGGRLPILVGELGHQDMKHLKEARCHCHVASLFDPRNFNLTVAQKNLKLDHDRLGHLSMQAIQRLCQPAEADKPDFDGVPVSSKPCIVAKDPSQLRCKPPICEACQVAKARRRPTGATKVAPVPDVVDGIRAEDLKPGDCVSADQYESAVQGRRRETAGKERESKKFVGGTLFCDHASKYISVRHQVSTSAVETIKSKTDFEREGLLCGVEIKKYRTDNGIFASKAYEDSLDEHQYADQSGVGAHHQNGVAEANIGRVQRMARAMLLHLRLHWPEEFSADLWPFALDYAVHIHNHFPDGGRPGAPAPIEVFCGAKVACEKLRRLRVFGCPAFVLDPRLQDGKTIPKWNPRARKGQFLGFSKEHASTVGLVRNLNTGYISPQFHIVFDELFDTVASEQTMDLSETWIDLFLNSRETYLEGWDESAEGPLPEIGSEWPPDNEKPLTAEQAPLESQQQPPSPDTSQAPRSSQGEVSSRSRQGEVPSSRSQGETPTPTSAARDPPVADSTPTQDPRAPHEFEEPEDPPIAPFPSNPLVRRPPLNENPQGVHDVEENTAPRPARRRTSFGGPQQGEAPSNAPSPSRQHDPTRRVTRSNPPTVFESLKDKSKRALVFEVASRSFSHFSISTSVDVIAFAVADWETVTADPYCDYFHKLFTSQVDPETLHVLDVEDAFHPFAFSAKIQSEDFPSCGDIIRMQGDERRKWMEAMDAEIKELTVRKAFEFVPREEPLKAKKQIVKSLWAFRRKRRPDGAVSRHKARSVVRGDLQKGQFSSNETFAPVVEWSTVRMLFSLSVMHNWKSASIDFKNAFTQGVLPEPIFLELPAGFQKANPELSGHVMKITTSLCGDRRAANIWHRKIRDALVSKEIGFECSVCDPCLFIRSDCMICLYVDDAIIHARDDATIEQVLKQIDEAGFAFSRDTDFASYLGALIEHLDDGSKKLSQPGLTNQLLEMMGMVDCNPSRTPIASPLFSYPDSKPYDGSSFNFRSALGMLMCLGNNTRPECAFAINACAQYSIAPKVPHAEAVRRICRYLKGTSKEGIIVRPSSTQASLDCFVDADFAGNWTSSEADSSDTVRSRAGCIISIGNVPVLWKSKRIHEICLSTMESECIALSMAMRSMVYLRGLLFEIDATFHLGVGESISTVSTVWEDNQSAEILATTDPPRLTPRSKSLAVKCHWFRSKLSDRLRIKHVPSAENAADIFTKAIPFEAFARHRKTICGWWLHLDLRASVGTGSSPH